MKKALLTDGLQRKTLSAVRALSKENIKTVSCETTRLNTTRFSKYNNKFFQCENPDNDPSKYIDNLIENIQTNNCEVLIPMDDNTMEASIINREKLEKYCYLAVPDAENFYKVYDKANSVKLAQKAGLNTPKTIFIKEVSELNDIAKTIEFPVIIKPRNSSGSRGMKIVKNIKDLIDSYLEIHNKYPLPIIQEFIEGSHIIDVCMIYNKQNNPRGIFLQKELRHFPVDIGPSTVQESVYFDEVKNQALKLMNEINWVGVIEIEFMISKKDSKVYFMEINPRFWASLELAIISGINFPKMYYDIATSGDCEEKNYYLVGKRVRNLIPGDILHYFCRKDKVKLNPRFWFPGKSVKDDIFRINDPIPFFATMLVGINYLINKRKRESFLKRD